MNRNKNKYRKEEFEDIKYLGFYKKKRKSWDDEMKGMYVGKFETTFGGGGNIYEIKKENKKYVTLSKSGTANWHTNQPFWYEHYILNKKGKEKIFSKLNQW